MDKETLSRFSWIIISLVIMSVIIAFVFSLVWVLGGDSVDSAKEILMIGPDETPGGGVTVEDKLSVSVGDSLFGAFKYRITGSGFDTVKFYKNGTLVKTLKYSTGGEKEFKFSENDVYYQYRDEITIRCYKGETVLAWDDGIYNFFDDRGPTIVADITPEAPYCINGTYYVKNRDLTLYGTVTDDKSGVASLNVNGTPVSVEGDNSWSKFVTLTSGVNVFNIEAIDGSGNPTTEKITIYYDNVKPELEVYTPGGGPSDDPLHVYDEELAVPTDTYTVSGKVKDTGIGIKSLTVKVNGKSVSVDTANIEPDGTWSVPIGLSATDVTTVVVVATDMLGNTATSDTRYVRWINWRDTEAALQFISSEPFDLSVTGGKAWKGTVQYHNGSGWQTWNGENISAGKQDSAGSNYCIYLRGTGNKTITNVVPLGGGEWNFYPWKISGNAVHCNGNIEALLDFETVKSGNHPTMEPYCFAGLFNGCTDLVTAPSLPATQLSSHCYIAMFNGCTSLTKAPDELPAKTLTASCYRGMFDGCKSLEKAPTISAATAANDSCNWMFANCTGLKEAPQLSVTTMADSCFMAMFRGCTSITKAPELKAEALAPRCYWQMFYGCTGLTEAPEELPAEVLAVECYMSMFEGCTAIVEAPEIRATRVAKYCCRYMFKGCTSLETAPTILPATRLYLSKADDTELGVGYDGSRCYGNMFEGCISLTSVPELPAENWMAYGAYSYMFKNCKSITETPELPAWFLTEECYISMFEGCTSLTTVNAIDAVHIGLNACMKMFYGCTSLTSVPDLKGTHIDKQGYKQAFEGCTSLTKAPALPALLLYNEYVNEAGDTTVYTGDSCYEAMFRGCISLTVAPNMTVNEVSEKACKNMFDGCTKLKNISGIILNDNTLEAECYYGMFNGTAITAAPELPAMNLGVGCYANMFSGCTSLTDSPELPAVILAESCYASMFEGCKALASLPELSATKLPANCYNSMFRNCSAIKISESITGEYVKVYHISGTAPIGDNALTDMFVGTTGLFSGTPIPGTYYLPDNIDIVKSPISYIEFISTKPFTLSANKGWNGTVEYNNGNGWTLWNGEEITSNGDAHFIYVRGVGNRVITGADGHSWILTGDAGIYCNGNIETLLDYTVARTGGHPTMADQCFRGMFSGCTSLVSAPSLPATTLSNQCYFRMFKGCTALTVAPELPAKTMKNTCYAEMFMGCTSLVSAPSLPAKTLALECYTNMFRGCTALTSAPELPATTLAERCYESMFHDCTSLTSAPKMTVNSIAASSCKNMFNGCKKLTTISGIALNATNLAKNCYEGMFSTCVKLAAAPNMTVSSVDEGSCKDMFNGCTALASAANISLNATTAAVSCYEGMFQGCTALGTSPSLKATALADYCYKNMFNGCSNLASVPNILLNATTLKKECYFGMFRGCTNLTTAPKLPATTLADSCYKEMFYDSGITKAPDLPATTLANNCYQYMFVGCKRLEIAPELPATKLAQYCYDGMFTGCTSLKTIPHLSDAGTATNAYIYLFNGCTNIKVSETYDKANGYTKPYYIPNASGDLDEMFIYTNGTFKGTPTGGKIYYLHSSVTVIGQPCFEFVSDSGFNITATKNWNNIEYSTDGKSWQSWNGTTITSGKGKDNRYHIYLKGLGNTVITGINNTIGWKLNGTNIECNGNIETLLDYGVVMDNKHPEMDAGCYQYMFSGCTNLVKAPELPATTLSDYCYTAMFKGCTNLTAVPSTLPATTLTEYCYYMMFYGCTSLTTVPRNLLPATTAAPHCYQSMFYGCTALKTVPFLPATTLADSCYFQMFRQCTSLTEIPYLPATTLANHCYNRMFCDAILESLISDVKMGDYTTEYTMPVSAAHLNSLSKQYPISQMFGRESGEGYIDVPGKIKNQPIYFHKSIKVVGKDFLEFASTESFTITATQLWNKTLEYSTDGITWTEWTGGTISSSQSEYHYIYLRGTGNTKITGDVTTGWTLNGSNVYCNGNIEYLLDYKTVMAGNHPTMASNCYKNIFNGWTGLVKSPDLPATTLTTACYAGMFLGCTNLKTAPALPATQLKEYCYYKMFYGCSSLKEIPYLPATTLVNHCYNSMFYGAFNVSATSTGDFTVKYTMPITKAEVDRLMPANDAEKKWPVSTMFNNAVTFGATETVIYLPSYVTVVGAPQ